MLEIKEIQLALELACIGYVYCVVLLESNGLLEKFGDLLEEIKSYGEGYKFLTSPLGLCEKCFTGQIAFWLWLWINYWDYNLIEHLSFTALSIIFVILIKTIINKWRN